MPTRRYALLLAVALILGPLLLLALAAYLEPVRLNLKQGGDLTRVGWYDDNRFAARRPITGFVEPMYRSDVYDRPYDVVVYGDSFSNFTPNGWPGFWVNESGLNTVSLHFDRMPLADLLANPWFVQAPPKLFIYQIVERSLAPRLGVLEGADCADTVPPVATRLVMARQIGARTEPIPRDLTRHLAAADLVYARDFVTRNLQFALGAPRPVVKLPVRGEPFSSPTQAMLAYRDELARATWPDQHFQRARCNLLDLQRRVQANGTTLFLALLIPDKTTAYRDVIDAPIPPSVLPRVISPQLNVLDVTAVLRQAIAQGVPDVYLPNDTHFGTEGHRLTALALRNHLQAMGRIETTLSLPYRPASQADRIFAWGEQQYTDRLQPPGTPTQAVQGYVYRHYPKSGLYVGIKDNRVYTFNPRSERQPQEVGPVAELLQRAGAAGF